MNSVATHPVQVLKPANIKPETRHTSMPFAPSTLAIVMRELASFCTMT